MHELWYNGILGMQGESQVDLVAGFSEFLLHIVSM
jgi:hypothetical protein